jgi:hypothetical protein
MKPISHDIGNTRRFLAGTGEFARTAEQGTAGTTLTTPRHTRPSMPDEQQVVMPVGIVESSCGS